MRASVQAEFRELQAKAGAEWTSFQGIEVARHFGDWQNEWVALRRRCGMLDASLRSLSVARGEDRISFLQGMVTTDVASLQSGQGAYGAILTVQGRVVSDLRLFVLTEEIWLDFPSSHATRARQHLERHIVADDVELTAEESLIPLLVLEGPQAPRVALAIFGESVSDWRPFSHRVLNFDGVRVRVARVTHTGEPGYLIFGSPEIAPWLWERSVAAGAEPVGLEAWQAARLEAGIPWVGVDMDESTLISEVGLEEAITYGKGCYLGQEVVERVTSRGQVQRRRVGLVSLDPGVPQSGAVLESGEREVGVITSAAWSPALRAGIAMGYLRREVWEEGNEVIAVEAQGKRRLRVSRMPFYG